MGSEGNRPVRSRLLEIRHYPGLSAPEPVLIPWNDMEGGYAVRRPGTRGGRALASRSQRALYAFAVLTVFLASSYAAVALLARVTPALFPGRSLKNVGVIQVVDLVAPVPEASESGSFRDPITVLILGSDHRDWQGDEKAFPPLTDTIMVARLDPVTKRTTFLSIPRDLAIQVTEKDGNKYRTRINESYQIGLREGGDYSDGVEQVKRDLKNNFGIEIDHYVILDMKGVEKLVDAVGGITIDIPEELEVPPWWYSNDDKNHVRVSFPAGRTTLDGYHAVAFGRYRETDSDLYRIKRQQLVLKAAIQRAFSSGVLGRNPADLWSAYRGLVKTDISYSEAPGLGDLFKKTSGNAATYSLGDPVDGVPTLEEGYLPSGAAVLFWEPENVQYWLLQAFPVSRYGDAVVEIQNAYGDPNLGESRVAALGRYLKYSKGLPTVYYGDDQPASAKTTVVVTRDTQRKAAEEIAKWLNLTGDRVVYEPVPNDDTWTPDIMVVVGKDFVIPASRAEEPAARAPGSP